MGARTPAKLIDVSDATVVAEDGFLSLSMIGAVKDHERRRTQASKRVCVRGGVWETMHHTPHTTALLPSALVTNAPTFALAQVAPKTERI